MKIITKNPYLFDACLIALIVVLSVIANIFTLGYYSDDWGMLSNFILSKDQSIWGLFQTATNPNTMMRPIMNLYDSLLFYFFSTQALGYHFVNSAVMIFVGLMIYVNLIKLKLPRIIALTIPITYILLPNYSSDRFWFAAFQSNLSILFYLINTYSGYQILNSKHKLKILWLIPFVTSIFISGLSYEVLLPLFLINIYLYWTLFSKILNKKNYLILLSFLILFSIILVFIYKLYTSTRLGLPPLIHMPGYAIGMYYNAFFTNFYLWLLHLPFIWITILFKYFSITNFSLSIFTFFIIFIYLLKNKIDNFAFILNKYPFKFMLLGIIYFIFGYAIFLTNSNVGFSPTGLDNRVAIASSLGLSIFIIGLVMLFINKLNTKNKYLYFNLVISIISSGNLLIINTIGNYWSNAYLKTTTVIANLQTQRNSLPLNSTVLFDGICSYEGPAPVIEARWDSRGIIQYVYADKSLYGDTINNLVNYNDQGIHTRIYNFSNTYAYKNLYIYNQQQNKMYELKNREDAKLYFEKISKKKQIKCPPDKDGHGVNIF